MKKLYILYLMYIYVYIYVIYIYVYSIKSLTTDTLPHEI